MIESDVTKRMFLKAAAATLLVRSAKAQDQPPNIVYINTDDLGSGDLGCLGSRIPTPNLDQMAKGGVCFGNFNAASAVCTPSRAALLTGRYPTRYGMQAVLWPESQTGIPDSETTIAQMLKKRDYRTMCVGKWHVGAQPRYLPTSKGFDEYFGIPYSHDMWPPPLMYNTDIVEQPASIDTLAQRYTQRAVDFIGRTGSSPFFLYLAHHMPHLPLASSADFRGSSGLGPYGDAVAEIDWSVGQVLAALANNGIDGQTLVMFSSDHGPWFSGSAGRLRGRKAQTFEGGVRVPFLARFPGRIPEGLAVNGLASHLDILPTLARLTGAPLPDNPLDGVDIWPLLTGAMSEVDRDLLLYFDAWEAQCARLGRWKLHVSRYNSTPWTPEPVTGLFNLPLPKPELYDLENDPGESYDVSGENRYVAADLRARMEAMLLTFPSEVRAAWRDTMSRRVEDTPCGAWPVRRP